VALDVQGRRDHRAARIEHLGRRRDQLPRGHESATFPAPAERRSVRLEGDLVGERAAVGPERVDVEDDEPAGDEGLPDAAHGGDHLREGEEVVD
jgi:hypothetical protein